jgi:diguanylate cyclase (GGDEF)-like protein
MTMMIGHPSPSPLSLSPSPAVRSGAAPAPAGTHTFDDPLMSRIDALLSQGFPLLRFPAPLEAQFMGDAVPARRRHFLLSEILALLLYNGFLIADYLMAPDVFALAVFLRVCCLSPICLFLILLASRPHWAIMRQVPPMLYEVVIVAIGLFAAATLAIILSETKSQYAYFYHVGFSVVVMYGNIVKRLRFWYAVVFSLALMGLHIAGVLMAYDSFPPKLVWPIVSLVGATALFSLVANYTMERDERRRYLLTLRERGVVRELSQTYKRLQALTHVDGLTGLYNRRHFQESLENVWGRAQYDKDLVSVMMIDIDQFKRYNERYGHPAGDERLQQVADAVQNTLRRPEDVTARYGGEEFIALMPHTSLPQAVQVAERLRQAVEALQIRHESSTAGRVLTVSIGVACVRADFPLKDAVLIAAADDALQQAKREGRNRVCLQEIQAALPPHPTVA